jgi:predicted nuclease of predicted toxin-antitoxin system
MKVLLDECVPRKLKREIANHEARTVTESGWSGLKNGELLALAEVEFNVFLTVDQNLIFQQNLQRFNIGIILIVARNNRFKTLLPLMPEVNAMIEEVKPGELARIGGS